jgi:hypothetical protein
MRVVGLCLNDGDRRRERDRLLICHRQIISPADSVEAIRRGSTGTAPRSSAPPAAKKTERLRGAFTPNAKVTVSANVIKKSA